MLLSALVASALTAAGFIAAAKRGVPPPPAAPPAPTTDRELAITVGSLIAPPTVPTDADPAQLNLLCAPGLSDADRAANLKTLDEMATAVAETTARNFHRFKENPGEFGSEAAWRLAMMSTVLGQDFKVRYDASLSTTTQLTASNRQFFAKSAPVFLTGCLGSDRSGTCASLPVLYVAVGRRLGYPMHLVAAKNHLFARWDDGHGTRVNLEAANAGGFLTHPDSYYRQWPFPITPHEEQAGGYLKNLDASQMLAIFLCTRALCLEAAGQTPDAARAASAACRIAPTLAGTAECLAMLRLSNPDPTGFPSPQHRPFARPAPPAIPGIPQDPTPGLPQPGPSFPPAPVPSPSPSPIPGQPFNPNSP